MYASDVSVKQQVLLKYFTVLNHQRTSFINYSKNVATIFLFDLLIMKYLLEDNKYQRVLFEPEKNTRTINAMYINAILLLVFIVLAIFFFVGL